MKQQMEAELLFGTPRDRDLAVAELTKRGFDVEFLDWVDEYEGVVLSETVWIKVSGVSELDAHGFFDAMANLAEQFNGDVGEAGLANPRDSVVMVHTPDSLRATHRRLARRVGRLEKADAVLAEMRAGAALHLQHTKQGPCWTLTTGREVPASIAKLVTASSSVVGVGDALFDGYPAQTFRWWRET